MSYACAISISTVATVRNGFWAPAGVTLMTTLGSLGLTVATSNDGNESLAGSVWAYATASGITAKNASRVALQFDLRIGPASFTREFYSARESNCPRSLVAAKSLANHPGGLKLRKTYH